MCLILLACSLFLPVSVSHFIVCLSIDTPLYWFGLGLLFTTAFSIYVGFWPKFMYIRGCSLKSHLQPPFWLSLMLWEAVGWVVSVVGYSWVLMLSRDYFFHDKRPFFIDFSLKIVLVIYILLCFSISALVFLS